MKSSRVRGVVEEAGPEISGLGTRIGSFAWTEDGPAIGIYGGRPNSGGAAFASFHPDEEHSVRGWPPVEATRWAVDILTGLDPGVRVDIRIVVRSA
jgi:hypothetical protein